MPNALWEKAKEHADAADVILGYGEHRAGSIGPQADREANVANAHATLALAYAQLARG